MKNTIMNMIVVTALSFSGGALAAEELESQAPPGGSEAPASAVPPATAAQAPQPAVKPLISAEPGKPERPKNLDLRHCLDLGTYAEIAKCAGEE